jgi:hypothetical protein
MPGFFDKYATRTIAEMHEKGASADAIAAKTKEMATMKDLYNKPVINAAITFIEPFPVGLIVTLVSAGILRKRSSSPAVALAQAI